MEDKMSKKQEVIDIIKEMSVLELSELVSEMEEIFGVSAAAPVAVAGVAAAGAGEAAAEKTEFDVVLSGAGDKKIQTIKAVRAITSLGLKEAKDMVDNCPKTVAEGLSKEDAEAAVKQLQEAGATAEMK